MSTVEQKVAQHYTHGSLQQEILAALEAMLAKSDAPILEQLARVDEFHTGGRLATKAVAASLALAPRHRVLDIGCGIGGAARFFATSYGCQVAGVDLTPEYIKVGNLLNARLGLEAQIDLYVASALATPFPDHSFARATMLHVGMNIADKTGLFAEVARVLEPGGLFVVYDVMAMGTAPLAFPVAWAGDAATSFVSPPSVYRAALETAGFEVLDEANKGAEALAFFASAKAHLAKGGPTPLGLRIVMGKDAPLTVANMLGNLEKGLIAPVQMLARRR